MGVSVIAGNIFGAPPLVMAHDGEWDLSDRRSLQEKVAVSQLSISSKLVSHKMDCWQPRTSVRVLSKCSRQPLQSGERVEPGRGQGSMGAGLVEEVGRGAPRRFTLTVINVSMVQQS